MLAWLRSLGRVTSGIGVAAKKRSQRFAAALHRGVASRGSASPIERACAIAVLVCPHCPITVPLRGTCSLGRAAACDRGSRLALVSMRIRSTHAEPLLAIATTHCLALTTHSFWRLPAFLCFCSAALRSLASRSSGFLAALCVLLASRRLVRLRLPQSSPHRHE